MTAMRDVSLKKAINVFTSAGIVARKACGSTIRIVLGQNDNPMLTAASYWLLGMAWNRRA